MDEEQEGQEEQEEQEIDGPRKDFHMQGKYPNSYFLRIQRLHFIPASDRMDLAAHCRCGVLPQHAEIKLERVGGKSHHNTDN